MNNVRNLFSPELQAEGRITLPLNDQAALTLIWCPSGKFRMGSVDDEESDDPAERPQHWVHLTRGFWMGETPVTQRQWIAVMQATPWLFEGGPETDDWPADATWLGAKTFCVQLTTLLHRQRQLTTDQRIDLPTEAQWEYACRAGTQTAWYFGAVAANLSDHGWYLENSGKQKHPAAQKLPNPWGFYDLYGNVGEWCLDNLHLYKPEGDRREDPCYIKVSSTVKMVRGGAFDALARECRSAARRSINLNNSYKEPVGLRLVCVDTRAG